jgi:ABC-type phosphate transport system auxiliary subunit
VSRRAGQPQVLRVRTTVREMERRGEPVTFAVVARHARVSSWLVYAEGVREHIEAAIKRQAARPVTDRRAGLNPSAASLRTDLELARQEITELRAERDRLRDGLRRQLGRQLDAISTKDLAARVDELTRQNQQLADRARQAAAENETQRARVIDLETDLAAARTSLRRMIRDENRPVIPYAPAGDA